MSLRDLPTKTAGGVITVATAADLPTDVEAGALRYVVDESTLYSYNGTTWAASGGGGGGDVNGPGSSTANAVARWDSTGGVDLLNSVVVISDTGDITGVQDLDVGNELTLSALGAGVLHTDGDGVVFPDAVALGSEVNGTLPVANGGTGSGTALSGYRMMQSSADGSQIIAAPVLSANVALVSDANGIVSNTSVTTTELGYLDGVTSAIQTQLDAKIDESREGQANGIATLDAGGKVPVTQLPAALMVYLGAWDAATNTPEILDSLGTIEMRGDVYRVSVAGTQNLGSGAIEFYVGDWVIYNGTVWQRSPAADFDSFMLADFSNVTAALGPADGGTGVSNGASSTLTRVGDHPLTLTTSNSTSLTLPTTGTLSTVVTTTRGDLIARGAATDQRLAVGTANQVLKSDGTDPSWTSTLDLSASTHGVKVEVARASPASGDAQNVYSGSYGPTYTRSGATFTSQTHYWMRVGNMVTVWGYAEMSAGGGTNDCTIPLPITPTAFSGTSNIARAQCAGACFKDSGNAFVYGTTSGTTATLEGTSLANAATGLRVHFSYRIA